jgi:uncharacterized protein (DUF3084 family)
MKSRYTNQIEKLEMELTAARRNLTATRDEHKAVVQLWEVGTDREVRMELKAAQQNLAATRDEHKAVIKK